jgi:hypothetical protein
MLATGEFIAIEGVVHLVRHSGVFLDVGRRRVFIEAFCMRPAAEPLIVGSRVTLEVLRSFADEKELVSWQATGRHTTAPAPVLR